MRLKLTREETFVFSIHGRCYKKEELYRAAAVDGEDGSETTKVQDRGFRNYRSIKASLAHESLRVNRSRLILIIYATCKVLKVYTNPLPRHGGFQMQW